MAIFEYSYRFSVDEEIIRRYKKDSEIEKFVFEFRINFAVKGREEEKIIAVGSERYGLVGFYEEMKLVDFMRYRLMDYWMPEDEIRGLINQALLFAKEGGGGRRPTVVDLDIFTLQQEREAIAETLDRAMRPEYVTPLYLSEVLDPTKPDAEEDHDLIDFMENRDLLMFLDVGLRSVSVRVRNDAHRKRLMSVANFMRVCNICGREPFVGSGVSTLRCGHAFHYHCIVRRLGEIDGRCPICHLRPYDESPLPKPRSDDHKEVRLLFALPPRPPPQQEDEKEGVSSIINEYC